MTTTNSPSNNKCSVPGCEPLSTAKYHRIPKRSWRAELWKKAINSPLLNDLDPQDLCKRHVCSNHFDPSDYSLNSSRCQLDNHVVPHKNMPGRASESDTEDKIEYLTFGSIIEGLDQKESNPPIVPEVSEEFHDFTEKQVFKVVQSPTVAQLNSVVYWAIPYVPKVDSGVGKINSTVEQINPAVIKNSIESISEISPAGPVKEICDTKVGKKKPLSGQNVPLKLWRCIKNLRGNNVSLQRENNLLRQKNQNLAQRLRRTSVLLRRTREIIKGRRFPT